MKQVPGGITAPRGFTASGLSAGIKPSRKPDLALVVAQEPVSAAGVFTTNRIQAAPVHVSRARLRRGWTRAVFINSGCANCLTGAAGMRDARRLGRCVARALGVAEQDVLVASTGVIGTRIPVAKVERAIPALVGRLSRAHHLAAATAMLTTDRVPKEAAAEARIGGVLVRVGGMAKGSGMIAPSMATMLCVLTTDVAVSPPLLRAILRGAAAESFNRISVDDDMSTNDTVFALASGRSGVEVRRGGAAYGSFVRMVLDVTRRLAEAIVEDGEGVSRVAEIRVVGGRTDAEAQWCARRVGASSLVRTMLAGGDPNVGRIAAAVGASGVAVKPDRLEVTIGGHPVVRRGTAVTLNRRLARTLLAGRRVTIRIDLHAGRGTGRLLSADLTEAYVRMNARYTT